MTDELTDEAATDLPAAEEVAHDFGAEAAA